MLKRATDSWQQGLAYTLTFLVGGIFAKMLPLPKTLAPNEIGAISEQPNWLPRISFDMLPTFSVERVNTELAIAAGLIVLLFTFVALWSKTLARISPVQALGGLLGGSSDAAKSAAPADKNIDVVRDGLEKQLSLLLTTVSRYLETSTAQSAEFGAIQERLASADTVEKIQAVVEVLMANSVKGQADAEELRTSLKDAQTQTVALQQKLVKAEKLAAVDALTSLPNRRSFQEFLDAAVEESHADYTPLCVIMADIDHFKRINDKFGHPAGDAVLKQFARVVSGSVREKDMVARYGGEEFVLVLKKTPMGNAVQVAERIRANINAASWIDPNTNVDVGNVTSSFGIAEINDGETAKSIVERADQRLYAAKKNGRNRVEICKVQR